MWLALICFAASARGAVVDGGAGPLYSNMAFYGVTTNLGGLSFGGAAVSGFLTNLSGNPYTGYTNAIAAGSNIVLTTAAGTTTLNVPTDFTNILYVNRDHNLSSILTNALVVTTNATGQYVGLMVDTKQSTNIFITSRDASAEFRTNTQMAFIATNIYKFYLFNAPTSRFVGWRLDDAFTGGTRSGWFSNNVPTNFMAGGIITKNGTNRANDVRFSRLYLQAPLAPPR